MLCLNETCEKIRWRWCSFLELQEQAGLCMKECLNVKDFKIVLIIAMIIVQIIAMTIAQLMAMIIVLIIGRKKKGYFCVAWDGRLVGLVSRYGSGLEEWKLVCGSQKNIGNNGLRLQTASKSLVSKIKRGHHWPNFSPITIPFLSGAGAALR